MDQHATQPEDVNDDLVEGGVHESNFYGVIPGIAGLAFGIGLIVFMFALADGFS